MNIVSYKDYTEYKPKLFQGMSKEQCSLFNAVIMKYLLKKYFKYYDKDLLDYEKDIITEIESKVWGTQYIGLSEREDTSYLISKLDNIGMDDEDEPRDLYSETIDVISSVDYASSEKNGSYEITISYIIENLINGIDRELDDKYPDYHEDSLSKMFTYKEMQEILSKIKNLIILIKDNTPPEKVLATINSE